MSIFSRFWSRKAKKLVYVHYLVNLILAFIDSEGKSINSIIKVLTNKLADHSKQITYIFQNIFGLYKIKNSFDKVIKDSFEYASLLIKLSDSLISKFVEKRN